MNSAAYSRKSIYMDNMILAHPFHEKLLSGESKWTIFRWNALLLLIVCGFAYFGILGSMAWGYNRMIFESRFLGFFYSLAVASVDCIYFTAILIGLCLYYGLETLLALRGRVIPCHVLKLEQGGYYDHAVGGVRITCEFALPGTTSTRIVAGAGPNEVPEKATETSFAQSLEARVLYLCRFHYRVL